MSKVHITGVPSVQGDWASRSEEPMGAETYTKFSSVPVT